MTIRAEYEYDTSGATHNTLDETDDYCFLLHGSVCTAPLLVSDAL